MPNRVKIPEGLWVKCEGCKEIMTRKEMEENLKVCPKCNYHSRLTAAERIALLTDSKCFSQIGKHLMTCDPLEFEDWISYKERLKQNQSKTQLLDAAVAGITSISSFEVVMIVMDFFFMGGSMGTVVGEKFVMSAEAALENQVPLLSIASSGGARMHEGIFSLMQMARTSAAVARLKEQSIPYISVLTDPTFGGVTASFAMLGDIIIAEPGSLIGFAGPRVIEQTIKQQLPEGFQRAEFQLQHGIIDMIVQRKELKQTIANLLYFFAWSDSRGCQKGYSKVSDNT